MSDKIVDAVREDLRLRGDRGIQKYGTTLERKDLSLIEWYQHHYEELLDGGGMVSWGLDTDSLSTEYKLNTRIS